MIKINHTVYIKDFNRFMFNKTKCKNKKHFCRYCLQRFSSEKILMVHREICLEINGKQSVELKSGTTEFKNYCKQITAPFKIYVGTECNLEIIHVNDGKKNASHTEKTKIIFHEALLTKLHVLINLAKHFFLIVEKKQFIN